MDHQQEIPGEIKKAKIDWLRYLLILLVIEKIIQHFFVTLAFYFNWGNIDATVAVNPDVLMVLGGVILILFILALWGMITRKIWAVYLLIVLAAFDIIGEFIAQGTMIAIQMNVSFLAATGLLILALIYRRRGAITAG